MPKIQFDLNDHFEVNPLSVCQDVIQDELLCKLPRGSTIVTVKIDYDHDIMTVVYRKKDELAKPPKVVYVARELLEA